MTHYAAKVLTAAHRVTVVCACGHESANPTEGGARARHHIHQHINEARAALQKGDG